VKAAGATEQPDQVDESTIPSWAPGPGVTLECTFVRWTVETDRKQNVHMIALVQNDAGDLIKVWAYAVVLAQELIRANPQPGDRLKIEFLGECRSTKGQAYWMYRVGVLSRAGEPSELEGGTR
jgi:hypothetical protein